MSVLTKPTFQVSLKNIAENYHALSQMTNARAAAVVKDNAYGLGAQEVAKRLYQEGCRAFFVAHGLEGSAIRSLVPEADIFVLQGIGEDSVQEFKKSRLTPVIASPNMLAYWESLGMQDIKPVIQVETGLNRLGFRPDDLRQLSESQKKSFSYILSHLACADDQSHFMNKRQQEAFNVARQVLNIPATLSASDGVFLGTDFHYDMVRLGAAMYGLDTIVGKPTQMKPVLTIKAPILQIANAEVGQFVGYGATFEITRPTTIAVVSIGYGDGIFRSLANKGHVRIQDKLVPIIGRISMDNIMVNITGIEGIKEGDFATILDDVYKPDDMAKEAGTIGYEIISRFGKGLRFCKSYTD